MKKLHFLGNIVFPPKLLSSGFQIHWEVFWINWSSPWDKICSLIFLILFKKVCLGVWKLGQWRKKCVVSVSLPQSHNTGFRVPWKQCLNLWSQRWLRPGHNLVRSWIPYGLWILKILFAQSCIKFSRFF